MVKRKIKRFKGQTVNSANAQARSGGILFAPANSKLCFELLTSFTAAQNALALYRGEMPPKSAFQLKVES